MKKIKTTTHTYKAYNEDVFYADETLAFVIDGASGLTNINISDRQNDVAWYVATLKTNILKYQHSNHLIDCIKFALQATNQVYQAFPGYSLLEDAPSAVIACVRVKDDILEYYVLGDCECILYKKDQTFLTLCDQRVDRFDQKAIAYGKKVQEEHHIDFSKTRSFYKPLLIEHRKMKNKKDGYFVLSDYEDAVYEAIHGFIKKSDVQSIVLMSDGFSQLLHLFQSYSKEAFFQICEKQDITLLQSALLESQQSDPQMNRYPRLSFSDDATCVYLEL